MTVNQSEIGKAIAILLVVFGHLGFIMNGGAIGVSMFLVMSGYGLAKSNIIKDNNLKGFWKKRLLSVYLPYLVWSIFLVSILYFAKSPLLSGKDCLEIILSIMGCPANVYDPTMWYISYAFLMYFLFWISYRYVKNIKMRLGVLCVLSCIIGCVCVIVYPSAVGVYLYIFSFPIGVLFAYKEIKSMKIPQWLYLSLSLGCICFLIYLSGKSLYFYELLTIMVSLFTIPLLSKINLKDNKIIKYIGESSFAIYLIEGVVMLSMWEVIGKNNTSLNLLCGVAILVLGVLLHYFWTQLISKMRVLSSNLR